MKNELLAGFLSFIFPGLGQLYVDKDGAGEKSGIPFVLSFFVALILFGANIPGNDVASTIGAIALLVIWATSIIHAVILSIMVNRNRLQCDAVLLMKEKKLIDKGIFSAIGFASGIVLGLVYLDDLFLGWGSGALIGAILDFIIHLYRQNKNVQHT